MLSSVGSVRPNGSEITADQILEGVDLSGATALVTGVSSGLGVQTARVLATHGARLVLAARDLDKAKRTLAEAGVPGAPYDLRQLDLADLASVRACADGVAADIEQIHLIVANAGVMATPAGTTADGFETQFGTNHLGHFVLVNRLLPVLVRSTPSRVVVVSSAGHRISDVDLDDPNFERTRYDPWLAYGRSKTAMTLFAVELDRRHRGRGIRAASVHPGEIKTELGRHLDAETRELMVDRLAGRPMVFKSVEEGAATAVWAGVQADPDAIGGRYCENCRVAEITTDPASTTGVFAYALDEDRAAELWSLSERLVNERFD